jgi:hypothetical protein
VAQNGRPAADRPRRPRIAPAVGPPAHGHGTPATWAARRPDQPAPGAGRGGARFRRRRPRARRPRRRRGSVLPRPRARAAEANRRRSCANGKAGRANSTATASRQKRPRGVDLVRAARDQALVSEVSEMVMANPPEGAQSVSARSARLRRWRRAGRALAPGVGGKVAASPGGSSARARSRAAAGCPPPPALRATPRSLPVPAVLA